MNATQFSDEWLRRNSMGGHYPYLESDAVARELIARTGDLTLERANEDILERYFYLIQIAAKQILEIFSEGELYLIIEAHMGGFYPPTSILATDPDWNLTWNAEVYKLDEKWGVDMDTLLAKFAQLSTLERFALADLVERIHNLNLDPAWREKLFEP